MDEARFEEIANPDGNNKNLYTPLLPQNTNNYAFNILKKHSTIKIALGIRIEIGQNLAKNKHELVVFGIKMWQ